MISNRSVRSLLARATARGALTLVAGLAILSCSDAAGPRPVASELRIVPLADSVFDGDVIHLVAQVSDRSSGSGTALVAWAVDDTTLAAVAGDGTLTLTRPGMVRITATARGDGTVATYDLAIGRLVAKRVELTPANLALGRGDQLSLAARVFGQGDRPIVGRSVSFTSDDSLVAMVAGIASSAGYLRAVGVGATTIRAAVDGIAGAASVTVVNADTAYELTQYNGSPIPVLIAADTVSIDGVNEFAEVYADSGTLVLSGLLQRRYQIDVRYTQYHVIQTDSGVIREPRFVQREFDRGLVTLGAGGKLAMESEFIDPLAHTAAPDGNGYLVHFRIPGDDSFLDLLYRRIAR